MNSVEGARQVIAAMNEVGVPYMLVGSLSSNYYAVPRSTKDADVVLESDEKLPALRDKLRPVFRLDEQIGFGTKLMTTKHVFHHRDTAFTVEVFVLSDDPHDQARFARRVRRMDGDLSLYIPTAEDVVIQKLRWRRAKDRADVVGVIAMQPSLDWPYLTAWTDRHGTTALLHELRDEADRLMGGAGTAG